MSQKQIDELKESIMIAKRNYSEKEFEMGEQLRAYNEWDYSRFLNDDYEKLPSIIRYFIYDILDNTDSYNKMNKLLDILIVLLWEDNM